MNSFLNASAPVDYEDCYDANFGVNYGDLDTPGVEMNGFLNAHTFVDYEDCHDANFDVTHHDNRNTLDIGMKKQYLLKTQKQLLEQRFELLSKIFVWFLLPLYFLSIFNLLNFLLTKIEL